MAQQFNERDLYLLDYDEVELKHDEPEELSVYDAFAKAGADRVMHRFIYLKSRCTQKGANLAVRYLRAPPDPTKNYVVKAASLDNQTVLGIIKNRVGSLLSHEDLIWQQFGSVFDPYLTHLSETMAPAPNFMQPRLKEPGQHGDEALPPISRYMRGVDSGDDGRVRILSAHAGVGKTTLARHLVRDLVKGRKSSGVVPIFVEAHHWEHLNLGEVNGLWGSIKNSLDVNDHLWGIIKNSLDVNDHTHECSRRLSADLFRHALRQGYLSFVFDGFDELCGSDDDFDAGRVLQELAEMVRESEARVLVTTRTLFWEAQIHAPPENVLVWTLDSFNSQQAHGYFRKKFGQSSAKTKHAESLYNSLRRESQRPREKTGSIRDQFVNLPLCVRMLADLVDDSQTGPVTIPPRPGESFLQRVLRGFCEREIKRIRIVSSAEAQLASFVDRAVESDQLNPAFDLEDLVLAVDGIKEVDLERLEWHGLLERPSGSGQYRFRYDFLGPHLRAVAVAGWLTDPTGSTPFGTKYLLRILRGEADGQGFVLEQLLTLLDPDDADVIMSRGRELGSDGPVGSFIFHLVRELIERLKLPREEEIRVLFAGLSGVSPENWNGELSGWEFRGTLESLHLAGVKFHRCNFRDVSFRGCVVDRRTEFSKCVFDGDLRFERGDADPSESQWKTVSVASDCEMSGHARFVWSDVLGGHSASRDARIVELLRIGLEKFWYSGQIRLMIRNDDWSKGRLGRTGRSEMLLRHMLKAGLVSNDFRDRIELARDSFPDLQNYMDNDQLSGRIRDVYERLARDDNV